MFSWFNRKKDNSPSVPWGINVDIHNHLLPGIDDGAEDVDTSIRLIQGLQELGFQQLIATPHIAAGIYRNNRSTIEQAFSILQDSNMAESKLVTGFAAEYMIDDYFDQLILKELISLPFQQEKKYVLVEFPYLGLPTHWHDSIFQLRKMGYQPILAHPERYSFIKPSVMLERFRGTGLLFQLNLLSLCGYYGKDVMKLSHFYLKEGLYDFAGTDVHHANHMKALQGMAADPVLSELIANYPFQNNSVFASAKYAR
jgi:protein-tyrosine phosphatase